MTVLSIIAEVQCPELKAPLYGKVRVSGGYSPSSIAYYSCNSGYSLHGLRVRKCLHDGTWYGEEPSCRQLRSMWYAMWFFFARKCAHQTISLCTENCAKLIAPRYGKVTVNGYGSSATAYYSCNYGYELDGAHSRICQHDGTWAGKAPECQKRVRSKFYCYRLIWIPQPSHCILLIIPTGGCSKLDAPRYGRVWVTGYSYSSVAYYSCNYGYELDGAYSRKCQHDYTWNGKAPECRPVRRGNTIIPIRLASTFTTHLISPQSAALNSMLLSMVKSGWQATATPQQPTTGATMDTTCMVQTLGGVCMMVPGMERLQNVE